MASGINFNPASYQVAGKTTPVQRQSVEQPVANPSDGFQSSGASSQAPVANPSAPAGVTLQVTAQELASSAFQQSLQALTSAGIPVSIVLLNATQAPPQSGSSQGGWMGLVGRLQCRIQAPPQSGSSQGGVGRQEFEQVQSTVNRHDRQIDRLEQQYGNISTPKPPTYGGD